MVSYFNAVGGVIVECFCVSAVYVCTCHDLQFIVTVSYHRLPRSFLVRSVTPSPDYHLASSYSMVVEFFLFIFSDLFLSTPCGGSLFALVMVDLRFIVTVLSTV